MKKYLILMFLFSFQLFAQEECYSTQNFLEGIENFSRTTNNITRCVPLSVGDAKAFDTDLSDRVRAQDGGQRYYAPNASQYLLKRVSEDTYDVVFNLNFTKDESATVEPSEMLERVQRCLAISSNSLFNSANKKIRLLAVSPDVASEMNPRPPKIDITITKPKDRGNAQLYASDFNCATITHELLHFLGLCDEYQADPARTEESQCRALGPNNSIMGASMNDVFAATVGEMGSCDLSNAPVKLAAIKSNNKVLKEAALRKTSLEALSFSRVDVGLDGSRVVNGERVDIVTPSVFNLFCSFASGSDINSFTPSSENDAFTRIDSQTETSLTTSSYVLTDDGTGGYTNTIQCDCSNQPASYINICKRFIYLAKFRLESLANPSAKIYHCPFYKDSNQLMQPTKIPNQDLDLEAGEVKVSGNIINFRDQPIQESRSLLFDAHFDKIIQGSCVTEDMSSSVVNYNQCARFSRSHSMRDVSCNERPPHCDGFGWLGNSNQ